MDFHRIKRATLAVPLFALTPFLLSGLQGCASPAPHAAHWSYEGSSGPEHWFPEFTEGVMKAQSPIRIPAMGSSDAKTAPPSLLVGETPLGDINVNSMVLDNGHTVVVSMPADSNIRVETEGGLTYRLLQYHFHSPSEHAVDGQGENGFFPLAVHAVHQSVYGDYLVVGRVYEVTELSPESTDWISADEKLRDVFGQAGEKAVVLGDAFNQALLPDFYGDLATGAYYYEGSLTTPPCTEKVHWVVAKRPLQVSKKTLALFTDKYGTGQAHFPDGNRRPIQATNGREIYFQH